MAEAATTTHRALATAGAMGVIPAMWTEAVAMVEATAVGQAGEMAAGVGMDSLTGPEAGAAPWPTICGQRGTCRKKAEMKSEEPKESSAEWKDKLIKKTESEYREADRALKNNFQSDKIEYWCVTIPFSVR